MSDIKGVEDSQSENQPKRFGIIGVVGAGTVARTLLFNNDNLPHVELLNTGGIACRNMNSINGDNTSDTSISTKI